ncbi:26S proteasome non-ATPase regulatory subunit 7 homolog a, partial [Phtheirospermum japonicum]
HELAPEPERTLGGVDLGKLLECSMRFVYQLGKISYDIQRVRARWKLIAGSEQYLLQEKKDNSYVPTPLLVIIDVQPKELGIPTKAYYAVEEVKENATQKSQKVFVHCPSEIAAHEVEEIGVEHLLRDVKDTTISTLATEVTGKLAALKGLDARLKEIRSYLDLVIEGKLPLNHEILYHLQDVFNLLPNLNVTELVKAFAVKTNDMMLVIYLSSLIRSVIALHNLINNKMLNKEHEKAEDSKPVAVPTAAS